GCRTRATRFRLRLLDGRPARDLATARLDVGFGLAQLLLSGVVRRIERERHLELGDGEIELPGGPVKSSPLEVGLRRLEARPLEGNPGRCVVRIGGECVFVVEDGQIPVLPLLLALAVAEGTRGCAGGGRDARPARKVAGSSGVSCGRHAKSFNLPPHGSGIGMRRVISGGRPVKAKSTDSRLILWILKRASMTSPSRALM